MKKFLLTLTALMFFTLGAQAYNYNTNAYPSNNFGGRTSLSPKVPTANGSAQAYQDMVNASYMRSANSHRVYYYDHSGSDKPSKHKRRHYRHDKKSGI